MFQRKQKGFTLVELLVVIAIIGLLSTLAVVALNSARSRARDARRISDIKQVQTALELYFADQTEYPVAPAPGIELGAPGATVLTDDVAQNGFEDDPAGNTVYIGQVPRDFQNPDLGGYTYVSDDGSTYTITFNLEGDVSGLNGEVVATPSGLAAAGN